MSIKISVTHAQEADKDIFKPGTLVQHFENQGIILVTTGDAAFAQYFCGVVITSSYYEAGHRARDWSKEYFTRFTGTITMEQGK